MQSLPDFRFCQNSSRFRDNGYRPLTPMMAISSSRAIDLKCFTRRDRIEAFGPDMEDTDADASTEMPKKSISPCSWCWTRYPARSQRFLCSKSKVRGKGPRTDSIFRLNRSIMMESSPYVSNWVRESIFDGASFSISARIPLRWFSVFSFSGPEILTIGSTGAGISGSPTQCRSLSNGYVGSDTRVGCDPLWRCRQFIAKPETHRFAISSSGRFSTPSQTEPSSPSSLMAARPV